MDFDAVIPAPFGAVGIRCHAQTLTEIRFLSPRITSYNVCYTKLLRFAFATKYSLPIIPVIAPGEWGQQVDSNSGVFEDASAKLVDHTPTLTGESDAEHLAWSHWQDIFAEHGKLVNSGKYDGLRSLEAIDAIAEESYNFV